jgi:hypothetical protein
MAGSRQPKDAPRPLDPIGALHAASLGVVSWEARFILDVFMLPELESDRDSLAGRLDWVTKGELLDSAGWKLSLAARKKIRRSISATRRG